MAKKISKKVCKKSCKKNCSTKSDEQKKCNDSLPMLDSVVIESKPVSIWSRIKKLFGYE